MRLHIFFLFLILLVPISLGFDCDYFSGFEKEECLALNDDNEDLIANLVYTSTYVPDHDSVYDYNSNIEVSSAPEDIVKQSNGMIKDAWVSLLYLSPSIVYNESLNVPSDFQSRLEYDYRVQIPSNYYNNRKRHGSTCKIIYSLNSQQSTLVTSADNQQCTDKQCSFSIDEDSSVESTLDVQATRKEQHYKWQRYCCGKSNGKCRYCYRCKYYTTRYHTDSLSVDDNLEVEYYDHVPEVSFEINRAPYETYKGTFEKDNETTLFLSLNNSYLNEYEYEFNAELSKKPYNFLTITAENQDSVTQRNFLKENNTLYFKDKSFCSIEYTDFFKTGEKLCSFDLSKEPEIKEFEKVEFSSSWNLLFKVIIFIFINLLIYKGIKKTWGKALIPILLIFLMMPVVLAEEECGLLNLASCIPQKMYDFFIGLLNAPLQPLLTLTRNLLETAPSIDLFHGVWAIMVYVVSLFYGLLFMYSGFQFLFSGHNIVRREMAKEWLKNTVIMITLIQGSFYLYGLILEIGSILTSSVLSMVAEEFFLITADNIINIGLEFLFLMFYVLSLFITILCLLIRYLIVASGVIFVPIGIFCYFIPPLRSYGKLILNLLGTFIFITFINAIIILACSMLIEIPMFANVKILVMIACFLMIDTLFLLLTLKAIFKSVFSSNHGENVAQAVKYVAMFA